MSGGASLPSVTVQKVDGGAIRWDPGIVMFVGFGGAQIVAGGLVAAVHSASPFAHGSWLAAYLVLVCGVAQIGLGVGRLALPAPAPSAWLWRLQIICWNSGNVAVMGGVLVGSSAAVFVGSVPLLVALGSFGVGVRAARRRARARTLAYDAFVLMLAFSVAIGCVLAGAESAGVL